MYKIAKQPSSRMSKAERIDVVDFIKENTSKATDKFDLRTQCKIENLFLYDMENWRELSKPLLPINKELEYVEYCLKNNNSIKDAQKEFCEETGLHRATFYRLKGRVVAKSH